VSDPFLITAGKTFTKVVRVVEGKNVWGDLVDFEVRAQLRQGKTTADPLIYNIHDDMTTAFGTDTVENPTGSNDILITWVWNGEKTRELFALDWGPRAVKKGFCNIILSDVGTTDGRTIVVPVQTFKAVDTTTTADGEV